MGQSGGTVAPASDRADANRGCGGVREHAALSIAEHSLTIDQVKQFVGSVGVTLSQARSTRWIAEEAEVSERTTRRHLTRLVEIGMLEEVNGESSAMFRPDSLDTRLRGLRDFLDEYFDLEELRSDLEERIEGCQSEYGARSPEELRSMAAHTNTADRTRQLRWVANDWETVRFRLGLVEEAIELRASGTV